MNNAIISSGKYTYYHALTLSGTYFYDDIVMAGLLEATATKDWSDEDVSDWLKDRFSFDYYLPHAYICPMVLPFPIRRISLDKLYTGMHNLRNCIIFGSVSICSYADKTSFGEDDVSIFETLKDMVQPMCDIIFSNPVNQGSVDIFMKIMADACRFTSLPYGSYKPLSDDISCTLFTHAVVNTWLSIRSFAQSAKRPQDISPLECPKKTFS